MKSDVAAASHARVFVDTQYLAAFIDERDNWHARALALASRMEASASKALCTDAVLIELGNYFSRSRLRSEAGAWLAAIRGDPNLDVVPLSGSLIATAEDRYRRFTDKNWSVTDCISMEVMLQRGIREIATNDHGFEQAGFEILLR
jgi:predicted nucleic acid-binding protein